MNAQPIALHKAFTLAERIVAELLPFCERIEIAGSMRRAREHVNDIDLVVLPKDAAGLRARVARKTQPITDGPLNLSVRLPGIARPGIQLDIFFAHGGTRDLIAPEPSNWGSVLLCRTGSKEHNIFLAQRAQELGYKWETMRGIVSDGRVVASESEEAIFEALGMDFMPPALRER